MKIKNVVMEDFINYKKPCMFILFPYCTFKCDTECGRNICQNSSLVGLSNLDVNVDHLIDRYINNPISKSIVCGGLEPFDSWEDLHTLVKKVRAQCDDDIVIYTGYNKLEISKYLEILRNYKNIIIKFGRYIPDQSPIYDPVLGVTLSSSNQFAEKIS